MQRKIENMIERLHQQNKKLVKIEEKINKVLSHVAILCTLSFCVTTLIGTSSLVLFSVSFMERRTLDCSFHGTNST